MPKLSAKGAALPASPIRKLVPFAEGAAQRGTEVLYLNIGQPDIPTPQVALDAVSNHAVKVLAYSHSAGFESYRRGLLTYYAQHNIDLELGDVMITTGGSEALLFAMGTILDAGDEIIIPEPYYANYSSFAQSSGAVVVPVSSRIEDGFALPPIAQIEPLITERTRALLLCHPGNPTGYLYTPEELNQLKELVLKHDLFLICYQSFVLPNMDYEYTHHNNHSVLYLQHQYNPLHKKDYLIV
jgi:aspartate aminotransferase